MDNVDSQPQQSQTEASQDSPQPVSQQQSNEITPQQPLEPTSTLKKRKWLLLVLIGIVVLALGTAGYFAYQNQQLKKSTAQVQPKSKSNNLLPITSPAVTSTTPPTGWQTFKNKLLNYQIDFPPDWQVIEKASPFTTVLSRTAGGEITELEFGLSVSSAQGAQYELDFSALELEAESNDDFSKIVVNQVEMFKTITINETQDYDQKYRVVYFFPIPEMNNVLNAVLYTNLPGKDTGIAEQILSTFKFTNQTSKTGEWLVYKHTKFPDKPDWKIPWKGFTLYYPSSWKIEERKDENNPSLNLKITKNNGDYFEIIQGAGGGGYCLFPDLSEYNTFEGMATQYTNFKEIKKSNGIIWRLADWPTPDDLWTHQLCEKFDSDMFKVGYKNSTIMGFTKIKVTTPESIQELNEILNKLEIIN